MTFSAHILADSISEYDSRLLAFELRYPRFIHAEFMTHRVLSRNASSSRAIPVKRLIEDIIADTAMPIHWGKNQPGMQAREQHNAMVQVPVFDPKERRFVVQEYSSEAAWLRARDAAIEIALAFDAAGYHKQIVNRLLEPFSQIRVVASATEWTNLYALRRHEDAQPEFKLLADLMWEAQEASEPKLLKTGEWHLPYVTDEDKLVYNDAAMGETVAAAWYSRPATTEELIKLSIARCASVSYKTVDGQPMTMQRAIALHDKLVSAVPLHASPAEHQATPDRLVTASFNFTGKKPTFKVENSDGSHTMTDKWAGTVSEWVNPELHGNLRGWIQRRKQLPNENITA